MFFQLDWFCTADRMFVFGLTLSVSALVCLALLFAVSEYRYIPENKNTIQGIFRAFTRFPVFGKSSGCVRKNSSLEL